MRSDRWVYIARTTEGDYAVFSLDDTRPIDLGDTLSGNFDDSDGLFKEVRNVTANQTVRICAENWGCSDEVALDFLKRLNSPTRLYVLENGHIKEIRIDAAH